MWDYSNRCRLDTAEESFSLVFAPAIPLSFTSKLERPRFMQCIRIQDTKLNCYARKRNLSHQYFIFTSYSTLPPSSYRVGRMSPQYGLPAIWGTYPLFHGPTLASKWRHIDQIFVDCGKDAVSLCRYSADIWNYSLLGVYWFATKDCCKFSLVITPVDAVVIRCLSILSWVEEVK